jgi:hypothetical protein
MRADRVLVVQLAVRSALFCAGLVAGAWPSAGRERVFSEFVAKIANPILGKFPIGGRVIASLGELPPSAAQGQNVVADTMLKIQVLGLKGDMSIGLTLRRDIYLPWLIFGLLILVTPLRWQRKFASLAVGSALTFAVGVASIVLLVAYLASNQLQGIYTPSAALQGFINFAFERWLSPPGNRVIAPLLLAGAAWAALRTGPARPVEAASAPALSQPSSS